MRPSASRPPSSARGVHHVALISSDVERTVLFYQDLLEFPLTDMFENRDYKGSTHFFFDIGNGNSIAFFDLPGLDLGPYAEVLGGLHHLAISVEPDRWTHLKGKLDEAGIEYAQSTARRSTSVTPTAHASSSSAIRWARCTAPQWDSSTRDSGAGQVLAASVMSRTVRRSAPSTSGGDTACPRRSPQPVR